MINPGASRAEVTKLSRTSKASRANIKSWRNAIARRWNA